MSDRAPCVRCGRILHTGEGRILVAFTTAELADLAQGVVESDIRARLLCALTLLDKDKADELA